MKAVVKELQLLEAARPDVISSRQKLNEYRKAVGTLRNQLNEMNLFNAKLLYANKLMQNQNVTPKQQRAIVEALDNAKTLREAKLLYKSLTASLNKRSKSLRLRVADGRSDQPQNQHVQVLL